MAEETKKISFGFTKLKKPSNLVKITETSKSDIEYVDSFDGAKGKFSYKGNVRCDEPVKKELVIPLIGTKTVLEVIKSRLESKKLENGEGNNEKSNDAEIKEEKTDWVKKDDHKVSNEPEENKPLSIDDLAAKEILSDLQNSFKTEKSTKALVIKQSTKVSKTAEEMQIDYENIPVSDFGLAMLRGMGWTPETGIGKDQKVVQVVAPKLRPKGLGLGADKVMKNNTPQDPDLTISIKSYVKFVNGTYKGNYGQVEAMDDDTGRVTVKLALGGMVSVSEVLLMPVTKKDYEKNSKVINPTKYEDFKEKAGSESEINDKKEIERRSPQRESRKDRDNRHRKERYDRSHERDHVTKRKEEEEERSSNGRKRYSSSDSSASRSPERSKHKKSKKSSRDESENRRHKKSSKKKKKKKRHSDYDTEESDERSYKREKSSHHSHHSKSKRR